MSLAIGVDIGGTKVAGGVVDADGNVLATVRRETPDDDAQAALDTVAEVVTLLRDEHDVAAVGIDFSPGRSSRVQGSLGTPDQVRLDAVPLDVYGCPTQQDERD